MWWELTAQAFLQEMLPCRTHLLPFEMLGDEVNVSMLVRDGTLIPFCFSI